MEKIIKCIKRLSNSLFTGTVTLNFHMGILQSITKEEEID